MIRSPVDEANEYVSVGSVLGMLGVFVPEYSSGRSWKTYCPFTGFFHSGNSKSLRVYSETNSAYCFSGCGYLTPVSLFSMKTGLSKADAAIFLLEKNGIVTPTTSDQLSRAIVVPTPMVSKASLREALQIYCQRVVGAATWEQLQFTSSVIEHMDRCITLLDKVKDEESAKLWLNSSKKYMSAVLKGSQYVKI